VVLLSTICGFLCGFDIVALPRYMGGITDAGLLAIPRLAEKTLQNARDATCQLTGASLSATARS
jgi:hypothetical protein